jgi:hypothetical protein
MSTVLARSRVSGVQGAYYMIGEVWSQAEQLVMKGKVCWMTPSMHWCRLGLKGSPGKQRGEEDMEGEEGLSHNSCCTLVHTTALIWQGRQCRESWHELEHRQGGQSSQ